MNKKEIKNIFELIRETKQKLSQIERKLSKAYPKISLDTTLEYGEKIGIFKNKSKKAR